MRGIGVASFAIVVACTATPLPTPPSLTVEKLELLEPQAGQVALRGAAGAVHPGGVVLRVTGPSAAVERPVADDGSFAAALAGTRADVYYLEIVQPAETLFVGAVTGGPGDTVVPADAGPDADADESPDAVDCDPDDPDANSRSCASNDPAGCTNLPETCNDLDDDCNGFVDDGVCTCDANDACNADQECAGNACVTRCTNADDCANGLVCDRGFCST